MMQYEELRQSYQNHLKDLAKLTKLEHQVKDGGLSLEQTTAYKQTIIQLSAKIDSDFEFFAHLEKVKDPIWMKMARELDAALEEQNENHNPISICQITKKFIDTMALLILGTWIIDGIRKR